MKSGTVVNVDGDFLWYIYEGNGKTVTNARKHLVDYVDYYSNHGISDIVFCTFCQCSIAPSAKWSWFGNNLFLTEQDGISVDYSKHPRLIPYYEYYTNGDCDPIEVLLDESRRKGMNPWISFRMNDVHYPFDATSWLRSKEYYDFLHKEGGKIHGNTNPYFDGSFNYENAEFRSKMLSYVKEQIDRYDMYGVELDFMREIMCFEYWKKPTEYYCNIITEFIRTVKGYLTEREKTVCHPIKLMVRLTRDIEQSKAYGFDAETWVKQGLVDALVPTPRWATTDSDMPISDWAKMVKGTKTEIYAGQELLLAYDISPKITNGLQTAKGYASAYFEAGADKTYLFNFFNMVGMFNENGSRDEFPTLWQDVSCPEKANSGTRRNVVTYQERDIVPKGHMQYRLLPQNISNGFSLPIQLGKISTLDNVTIYIVVDNKNNSLINGVSLNGCLLKKTDDVSDIYVGTELYDGKIMAFTADGNSTMSGKAIIEFFMSGSCELKYVEVCIKQKI